MNPIWRLRIFSKWVGWWTNHQTFQVDTASASAADAIIALGQAGKKPNNERGFIACNLGVVFQENRSTPWKINMEPEVMMVWFRWFSGIQLGDF